MGIILSGSFSQVFFGWNRALGSLLYEAHKRRTERRASNSKYYMGMDGVCNEFALSTLALCDLNSILMIWMLVVIIWIAIIT